MIFGSLCMCHVGTTHIQWNVKYSNNMLATPQIGFLSSILVYKFFSHFLLYNSFILCSPILPIRITNPIGNVRSKMKIVGFDEFDNLDVDWLCSSLGMIIVAHIALCTRIMFSCNHLCSYVPMHEKKDPCVVKSAKRKKPQWTCISILFHIMFLHLEY